MIQQDASLSSAVRGKVQDQQAPPPAANPYGDLSQWLGQTDLVSEHYYSSWDIFRRAGFQDLSVSLVWFQLMSQTTYVCTSDLWWQRKPVSDLLWALQFCIGRINDFNYFFLSSSSNSSSKSHHNSNSNCLSLPLVLSLISSWPNEHLRVRVCLQRDLDLKCKRWRTNQMNSLLYKSRWIPRQTLKILLYVIVIMIYWCTAKNLFSVFVIFSL